MAIITTDDKHYKAIADTIRRNGGPKFDFDEKFTPEQMPSAIVKVGEFQYEEGGVFGYGRGYEDGRGDGYANGYNAGRADGYNSGKADGIAVGVVQGRQAEYDEFWDTFQNKGGSFTKQGAFAGRSWTDARFKPKYPITFSGNLNFTFAFSGIENIKKCIEDSPVEIVFGSITNNLSLFAYSRIISLPALDFSKAATIAQTFEGASRLTNIDKITVAANTSFSGAFASCSALTHIIVDGTIGKSGFDIQYSPLDKESLTSIVNALSTTTSGLWVRVSQSAVNKAFETSAGANDGSTSAEWIALAATKSNWTISLL
jgi:hypothetical protein